MNAEGSNTVQNNDSTSEQTPLLYNSRSHQDQATPGPDTAVVDEPSTKRLLIIMSSIWVGGFLAAVDITLIATLTGPISESFGSLSLISWLASAYFIANAALQPLSGKLTDIFGRRAGLIFSNIFFAIGNLICGLATEDWVIVVGRVVAGAGGGGLTTIATFVASDLIPLRKRALWQGYSNLCYGVGAGLGGVFGGWVNDVWGWRWAFLAQIPVTLVSTVLVWFTVKIPTQTSDGNRWKRIDYAGATTLILALVLLLLGLNSGGNTVP